MKSIDIARNRIERDNKITIEDRYYIISFENEIENIFKLLDVKPLEQLKNTQV